MTRGPRYKEKVNATSLTLRARFFRLALPNVLSNLMVPLAGLVDTAMLGHLGSLHHLAGVALASVLFDYVYWTFGFLRMGTTGLAAQAMGRGDTRELHLVASRGALVALVAGGLLVLGSGLLGDLGFGLLTGAGEVKEAGRAYFDARILGAPAALLNFVVLGWLLGRERSDLVLVMAVVGNGANIVLDYLLIFHLGLESYGAGLATMASQYLMVVVGLFFVFRLSPLQDFFAAREHLWERAGLRRLIALNGDIMVRTFALQTTFALFINFSATLGTLVLAANAVVLKVLSLASYFIDGFAFATESLAGIFKGQGARGELRRLLLMNCGFCVGTGLLFALGVWGFPEALYGILTHHKEMITLAGHYTPWLVPVLGAGGLAYALDGYFLGLTDGRALRQSTVLAALVGFVPLALWGLHLQNNHLLWGALAVFMVRRGGSLALRAPGTYR